MAGSAGRKEGLSRGDAESFRSQRVPALKNPLVCTSMRSSSGPDSVLRKPYEDVIMGPCVDTETGCKPEFLITHGHKGDRGIFCRVGCRRSKPHRPVRMGQWEPRSTHRPHRSTELCTALGHALGSIPMTATALCKTRELLLQSMPGFLHSALTQRSLRLAHFINKVKQHVKKILHLLMVQAFH